MPGRPPSTPVEVRSGPVVAQDPRVATLILIVGLPAAGKPSGPKNSPQRTKRYG
jgi:hypothetical protein